MRVPLPAAFLTHPIAHRGYHLRALGCIENSAAAIRGAVAAGYGIEIDLQMSSDGVPMVFHDEMLDRLTGEAGLIHARPAAELTDIVLKDSTDTIPTLALILTLIAGRVPLLIEIKDQTMQMTETDGRLEAAAVAALARYDGPVALMSFNPSCLAHLARLAPHLPRGLTTDAFVPADWSPLPPETCAHLRGIPDYDATQCSFISHHHRNLTAPRVAELRAQGAAVLCWTIRSPDEEAAARKIAQNITFEGYAA